MSSKVISYLFIALFAAILLSGCSESPEKPASLIEEDTYTSLLVELELTRTYAETGQIDSLSVDSLRTDVFRKYGVTSAAFSESHNYYQQFPKEQVKRVEEAIEKLRMDQVVDSSRARGRANPPN